MLLAICVSVFLRLSATVLTPVELFSRASKEANVFSEKHYEKICPYFQVLAGGNIKAK
jgi:hypothetical protein